MFGCCLVFLGFFHGFFIVCGGFPFFKGNGTCWTFRKTVAQSVAEVLSHQFGFSVYDLNGPFVAGLGTGTASVAAFPVDPNNFSYHFFDLRQ